MKGSSKSSFLEICLTEAPIVDVDQLFLPLDIAADYQERGISPE